MSFKVHKSQDCAGKNAFLAEKNTDLLLLAGYENPNFSIT